MSRPPTTSRKVGRVLVLLALFLVCLPEPKTTAWVLEVFPSNVRRATQTARAFLGAGAVQFPRWDVMYGMERRRSASQSEVGSSGNMGTELAGRTQGQGGKPRPRGTVLSLCPEELRLMALWMVVRPKTRKTSRRQGFVVSAWRALCCSDGVSFAPGVACQQHM